MDMKVILEGSVTAKLKKSSCTLKASNSSSTTGFHESELTCMNCTPTVNIFILKAIGK